jgi:hypothetical protein
MEALLSDSGAYPTKFVLKLYDWRYAVQLRKDNKIDPWTNEHETAYIGFVCSGKAKDFIDKLRNDEDFEEPEEGWNIAENETYLFSTCANMFHAETAVYETLHAYQGNQIPRLIAPVTSGIESLNEHNSDLHHLVCAQPSGSDAIALDIDQVDTKAPGTELLTINGILIEFIEGFTLTNLNQDNADKSSWQSIIDQAIQNINLLSDNDILNEDVRGSNILVSPISNGVYRVCAIDFAECRFRDKSESDLEWGRAKWTQDEEGAVGLVMKSKLAKQGFKLNYEPSMRYLEWAKREEGAAS